MVKRKLRSRWPSFFVPHLFPQCCLGLAVVWSRASTSLFFKRAYFTNRSGVSRASPHFMATSRLSSKNPGFRWHMGAHGQFVVATTAVAFHNCPNASIEKHRFCTLAVIEKTSCFFAGSILCRRSLASDSVLVIFSPLWPISFHACSWLGLKLFYHYFMSFLHPRWRWLGILFCIRKYFHISILNNLQHSTGKKWTHQATPGKTQRVFRCEVCIFGSGRVYFVQGKMVALFHRWFELFISYIMW